MPIDVKIDEVIDKSAARERQKILRSYISTSIYYYRVQYQPHVWHKNFLNVVFNTESSIGLESIVLPRKIRKML